MMMMMMTTASLRRLAVGGLMTTTRRDGVRLVTQLSPRSTSTVEGADVGLGEHDDGRRHTADEDAGSGGCPFKLPISATLPSAPAELGSPSSTISARSMHELDGPIGWPIVGNFLTYLKKENQGKMHEVQVSTIL